MSLWPHWDVEELSGLNRALELLAPVRRAAAGDDYEALMTATVALTVRREALRVAVAKHCGPWFGEAP